MTPHHLLHAAPAADDYVAAVPPADTRGPAEAEATHLIRRPAPPPAEGAAAGPAWPTAEGLRGLAALPEVGDDFAGFLLVGRLGRGAFGTVFLARQGELADRPVALKVCAD